MTEMLSVTGECFDGAPAFVVRGAGPEMAALLLLVVNRPLVLERNGDEFFLHVKKRDRKRTA